MGKEKIHISLVVIGHVDAGKYAQVDSNERKGVRRYGVPGGLSRLTCTFVASYDVR